MMVNLNKLAAELHEAAVQKGFWDVEDAEIKHIAKMHSELSEALQEDRCGRPMLYVDDIEVMDRITDPAMFDGRKPEGVAAELADFVMMVLDWAAARGIMLPDVDAIFHYDSCVPDASLPELVRNMHEGVVTIDNGFIAREDVAFASIPYMVNEWLKARGIDLWQIVQLKMEYNRSRPKLHGRAY